MLRETGESPTACLVLGDPHLLLGPMALGHCFLALLTFLLAPREVLIFLVLTSGKDTQYLFWPPF
jgi:hypothetical protein